MSVCQNVDLSYFDFFIGYGMVALLHARYVPFSAWPPPDIDRGSTPRVGLSYCRQGWTHHTGSCDVQFIFGVGGGGTGYSAMEDPTLDIINRETLCVAKNFGILRIAYFLLQI